MLRPNTPDGWMRFEDLATLGLKVSYTSLRKWREQGCPLLGGADLRTRQHPDNRRVVLFWRPQMEKLRDAFAPAEDEFHEDGYLWVWAQRVPERFKITTMSLHRWARRGCAFLDGEKLDTRTRPGSFNGSHVHTHHRTYYRADQLRRVVEARGRKTPADWLAFSDVQQEFGFGAEQLARWSKRCPMLGGRRLHSKVRRRTRTDREARLWWRPHLEQIRERRNATPSPSDHSITTTEAVARFGVTLAQLGTWRNRGKLKGTPTTAPDARGYWRPQLSYRTADVQRLAGKGGAAPTVAAQPTAAPATPATATKRGRGRQKVSRDEAARRLEAIAEWEQYRDSEGRGAKKEVFCLGRDYTAKDLSNWLSWRGMRNGPSRL